jgi:hypothetical protein
VSNLFPVVSPLRFNLDLLGQVALGCRWVRGISYMRIFGVVALCAAVGGCASSTGILPAGPDTYTMSERYAPIRGGSDEAERVALTKANEFCSQQGRQFVPNSMGQSAGIMNQNTATGYTVTFKCLLPNDPAIAKYQPQPAPNVIIEQRNR